MKTRAKLPRRAPSQRDAASLGRSLWRWLLLGALAAGACAHAEHVAPPPASALPAVEVDESGVPFAPAPDGLLRPRAVGALQDRLVAEGLLAKGRRSGTLDPPTREALRAFQAKRGLPATGLPSYRTVEALSLEPKAIFFDAHHPPPAEPPPAGDHGSVGGPTALAPTPR